MNKFFVFSFSLMMSSVVFAVCPKGTSVSKFNDRFCCKDGWAYTQDMKKFDYFSPYCGCPDGGTFTLSKDGGPECCKNNLVYNGSTSKYDYVRPQSCGCPDGGKVGANGGCCKNDYQYNEETHKYDYLNPGDCGCPNGGEVRLGVGVNDGNVCCKDGYAHKWYFGTDPVIYDEIDADKCGCPDGAIPSKIGRYCCKDGFVLGEKYIQPHVCGCPDGGSVIDNYNCIKNGFLWNDTHQKYDKVSTKYGCPSGSMEISGICCKGKFAYNNDIAKFDLIDGRCGCPEGSKHSSWGAALMELGEDSKLPFVMSLCCKNGKAYDPQKKKFSQKIAFCEPVPNDKKEISRKLLEMDLPLLSLILKELH